MNSNKSQSKLFAFASLLAMILLTVSFSVYAGGNKVKEDFRTKQPQLWRQISQDNLRREQRAVTPEKYLVFRLDRTSLRGELNKLPLKDSTEARESPLVMEIPMPDGSLQKFRMEQTAVLSPELAAQYPDWKTFTGYGIDDITAVGQFDWNALGFHGYIETDKGIVYIDPYQKGDTENYLVFYKHEFGKPIDDFSETVNEDVSKIIKPDYYSFAPQFSFGSSIRTYRLAVATTGEWTRNAGGYPTVTDPVQLRTNALAVIMTTVNRLNGIYTRELASNFQLVNPPVTEPTPQPSPSPTPTPRNIVFDDPDTDPYNNTDNPEQLNINQRTLDTRVGTANYDIGHLYGTNGGGVAASPSLCSNISKARGYSARGTNTGDPFVVDYVAHEIGHQFGGDHTYNNLDTSSSGGVCTTRAPLEAFEVASGSTIMSYVGICSSGRNLQQYVDTGVPSFHISSMTVINRNITTGDPTGCGTSSGTNNIPTVNAGVSYTIPRLTPFTLTASGTDADTSDVANLLYSWEEYDLAPTSPTPTPEPSPEISPTPSPTPFAPILGASGPGANPPGMYDVDTDSVLRPLFRAFAPVASNLRTFPSLPYILNPANNDPAGSNQPPLTYMVTSATGASCAEPQCVVGERLPTVNRTMNFRVSIRDRRGGVMDAGTTVTVAAGAGPFQITTQNSTANSPAFYAPEATWQAGTMQTVTWDVANTGAGTTVNAANVNILLSTDGGLTFPIILAASTPNDGTEPITVPNNPTSTARIKVEAVGNIFFDINNVNFAITAPTAAAISISGRVLSRFGRGISNAVVTLTDAGGVARTARTNPFGYYRFAEVAAGQTYVLNVSRKGFQFSPRVVSVSEDLVGFDFVANN